ncbi:MAG TPA: DUF2935 domain-containing protein, partial [Sporolactobacillaceae bacterium]|nr:DUF2935 domain-containing protein [Sporolactobacillaceae bacterium]
DHSRFVHDALGAEETAYIQNAKAFIETFDYLLEEARSQSTYDDLVQLSIRAKEAALALRLFKLEILKRQTTKPLKFHLTPTFLSHMVNELEEYLLVLEPLTHGECPPIIHEIHHHLLWLSDAYGHSGAIHDLLDGTEIVLKETTSNYTLLFKNLYLKAEEMAGLLRTGLTTFPALNRFNREVDLKMSLFRSFLSELKEWELSNEVLDILSPLMADHMGREECYYLIKLAEASGVTSFPDCDPTSPRVTA